MRYLLFTIFGALSIIIVYDRSLSADDKHDQKIREELSTFIDTVKAITMCQVWNPGKEGEPYICFIRGGEIGYSPDTLSGSAIAGEYELKILSYNYKSLPSIEESLLIPYMLIDYAEYQPFYSGGYAGQDLTLYLNEPLSLNITQPEN